MSSNFPTAIDSITDPTSTSKLNSPSHSAQHIDENDAIEKIEAKVGINTSAVTTSIDYKLRKGLGLTGDADAATITFSMATSNIHTVTLGGNRILAVSNVSTGQAFIIRLIQDATPRTVTWWATIKWPSGTAPTLSTANGTVDVFGFLCTGTNTYDGYFLGFGLS